MKKTCTHSLFIISLCLLVGVSFSSCMTANVDYADIETARLVVSGVVTYADGSKASGIKVSIYGVRAETEFADMNTYNYAITDPKGEYTIIRYRGRECPKEVVVVASDPNNVYAEQTIFAPITYDRSPTQDKFNGFATANFVMHKK
ncbi:MAG: hypothetical protein U0K81_06815 [Paludibacteraceae bacterium]|nr:hypothetical protein [Paludibacteraceae bacterium]